MCPAIQQTGAWIFLSHSHWDLVEVRKIRDELEDRGHNPLIFYLKCLEDDSAELPDLLRREIEARHWFILCDSPNAQASKWVQEEIAMIHSIEGRTSVKVDLSKPLDPQLSKIAGLLKRATVFLSYAQSDAALAQRIADYLAGADYSVWTHDDIHHDVSDLAEEIHSAIDDAVQRGFVLVLLSQRSLSSPWCRDETEYALAHGSARSNVIPVIIERFDRSALPENLWGIQAFDLTAGSFEKQMDLLMRSLKNREME